MRSKPQTIAYLNVEEYCLWCNGTIGQFLQGGSNELCPCCDELSGDDGSDDGDDEVFTGCDNLDLDAFAQSLGFMGGAPKFCNECNTNSDFASQYSNECGCCEGTDDEVCPETYTTLMQSGAGGSYLASQCCHYFIYGDFTQNFNPQHPAWPNVPGNPCFENGVPITSVECCEEEGNYGPSGQSVSPPPSVKPTRSRKPKPPAPIGSRALRERFQKLAGIRKKIL